jgi:hypothetical protein
MTVPDNPPRQNTLAPPGQSLSKEHEHELLDGSGISREFVAARGYYTATRRSEVPEVFPERQRRLGLVVPLHSPDGESIGYQLKPKKPRHEGPKYVTPAGSRNVLDVKPLMLSALRNTAVPLWITEGAKKVDALASSGRCAIGLAGVWNWLLKGGDPLPCWRHVPLQGRRVYVAFDSDWRTNPSVQSALARLVWFLEEGQGATVLVADIPNEGDGKTGIDDYFAGGRGPEELERSARPYSPTHIATERLSRDEKLRARISSLWSRWRKLECRTRGDYTDRSILRGLILEAEQCGNLVKDGVRVKMGQRALALKAGVSTVAPSRSIPRLEESAYLRRDNEGRKADEPGAFILLVGATEGARYCRHSGEKGAPKEKVKGEGEERKTLLKTSSCPGDHSSARCTEEVPELRWSTIRFREEKDERGRVVRVGDYVARIGKKRAAILEHLVESGGVATIPELMKRFECPKERPRDFKRRTLGMLTESPAIVLLESDVVTLTHGWREALEGARLITDEQGDHRRQEQKHRCQWEAFRRRGEHPAGPEPAEPEMPQVDDLRKPRSRPDRRRPRAPSWVHPRAPKPTPAQEAAAMEAILPEGNSPAQRTGALIGSFASVTTVSTPNQNTQGPIQAAGVTHE